MLSPGDLVIVVLTLTVLGGIAVAFWRKISKLEGPKHCPKCGAVLRE
jgi:hypothetical protein